ncbi:J domain-containing protein [Pricia sp.]|uniref:J domain-containing protein n=1 Tax=Pricia sp. TaxID=2268138 RepID=UPI003594915B
MFFGGRGGNDPFQGFGGSGRQRGTTQIGNDIEAEMPITLLEAYQGGSKTFGLNGEKLRIDIRPGSYDGQRLRIKGKGDQGSHGGKRGDLYIVLNVLPDPRFRREGGNLVHTAKVDIYTAILGGKVEIPTLTGTVNMTLPKGTDPGKTLRLKGKGMPKYGAKSFGDLLVKIEVALPKDLSAEEEELFSKLKSIRENKTVYQNWTGNKK